MTELLSREKEFLKLNEELDKLAVSALEQQRQQQHTLPSGTPAQSAHVKPERYLTYTKGKGPSTLLKKRGDLRGAGDCCATDAIVETTVGTLKSQHQNRLNHSTATTREYSRQTRGGKINATVPIAAVTAITTTTTTSTATAAATNQTAANSSARQDDDNISIADSRKDATGNSPSTVTTHRKSIRSPDISTRTYSRTYQRITGSNAAFTVKYRNPKFVESPSLEVLVKDETAMIRHSVQPVPRSLTETESVISTTVDTGGPSTRRSQVSTARSKQISTEGLIKFLKSKIAILEEDHERISQEMNQQKELLEKTLERHKKVEQQRDQAYCKHNAISEQLTKAETQLDEANRRIKERMLDQSAHQKELEVVRRELKMLTQTNTNLEKRLYRAHEELENTKNALTLMKNTERELKETMRVDIEGKDKQIKSLKKQRADLLNAYKKQLFLIDNLKRQNICMEQSKMIGFGEKDFTNVLEWSTKG